MSLSESLSATRAPLVAHSPRVARGAPPSSFGVLEPENLISLNGTGRGGGVIFFAAGVSKKRHSRQTAVRRSTTRLEGGRIFLCDVSLTTQTKVTAPPEVFPFPYCPLCWLGFQFSPCLAAILPTSATPKRQKTVKLQSLLLRGSRCCARHRTR